MKFEPILTRNIRRPDSEKIATYLAHGGYEAVRVALTQHTPAALVEMVKRSGLRGRGGAGFPAGVKWGFMSLDPAVPSATFTIQLPVRLPTTGGPLEQPATAGRSEKSSGLIG